MTATQKTLKVGTRVELMREVERFPNFIVPKGAQGTVSYLDDEVLGVTMDDHIDGCEEWENEVIWDEYFAGDIAGDLRVIA